MNLNVIDIKIYIYIKCLKCFFVNETLKYFKNDFNYIMLIFKKYNYIIYK